MYRTTCHRDRYALFSKIASGIVALGGMLVVIGWISDIRPLQTFIPGAGTPKFNTGLSLLLSGISLWLLSAHPTHRATQSASAAVSALVLVIGMLTVAEYAGNIDLGIDQYLIVEHGAPITQYPGRMGAIAAVIFVLLETAMLLLNANVRSRWIEGLTLVAMFNALIPALGYMYGASSLYLIPYYGTVALPTALLLILLCAGILAARPDRGVMALLTNKSAGGITARRLLPGAVLIPLLIDRLQFWGQHAGLYDATFAMILLTLSSMVLFTGLIAWNAHLLLQLDIRRDRAEDNLRGTLQKLGSNIQALSRANFRLQEEIVERRAAEEKLFDERERAEVTLKSIGDGVITTDIDGKVVYLNPAAEKLSGWTTKDAVGRHIAEVFRIIDPVTRQAVPQPVESALYGNDITRLPQSRILVHRDGSESTVDDTCAPIHDPHGKVIGAVVVIHDVSAVRAMSLKMAHVSQHDALTDLPNRVLLNDRLSQAIALALRNNKKTAVLLLDLDRFKHVNDMLGHYVGDRLLKEIAKRIKGCMREADTVSRQGGDEFIILLQEVSDTIGTARAATQVLSLIAQPYFIDDHEVHITGSLGISVCPDDGEDADTLIKHADAAMYQAKMQGRNKYQFFTPGINERAVKRFALEGSLRRALAREESALYYQPKMDVATGSITGAEALLRWPSRGMELASAAQFIPIAEESGLIIPIGEWVLRKACEQNRAWQEAGYAPIPIAVNVSAVQFKEKNFLELVSRTLDQTGLDPRYLELELTESVTMQDIEFTITLLESLKEMGVGLAIDDFGTGYSSLSYLKRFPIDTLKVDRSFIKDIVTDPDDAAITSAIISMAKILKQKVVAEGVETLEQFEFLRTQGCDLIQGYYVSEPLSAEDFERKILQRNGAAFWPLEQEYLRKLV
jgi:diguanylate cyclase (GGDEF)-like protein/PAS domain S-box-containing protein